MKQREIKRIPGQVLLRTARVFLRFDVFYRICYIRKDLMQHSVNKDMQSDTKSGRNGSAIRRGLRTAAEEAHAGLHMRQTGLPCRKGRI